MVEHKCEDGKWKPGLTRDCPQCGHRLKPKPVKRSDES